MKKNVFMLFVLFIFVSCQSNTDSSKNSSNNFSISEWFKTENLKEIKCDLTNSFLSNENWYKDAVFYHIWIKAFNDSNGDGIGDLNGIMQKLDYLNDGKTDTTTDLGINAIWLSPVFECDYKGSNMHGYDTIDYYKINSSFGTETDLTNLLKEAHKRGIRVIFDFIPNHTSNNHPWFKESSSNTTNSKRDWYIWNSYPSSAWQYAWGGGQWRNVWHPYDGTYYYGAFYYGMPDLNFNNIDVRTEIANVMIFWLNKGFDGTRIDAIRYLYEEGPGRAADLTLTHEYCKQLRIIIDKYKSTGYSKMMVGEVWTEFDIIKKYYGNGTNEFNMCFDFPLAYAISNAVRTPAAENVNFINNIFENEKISFPQGYQSALFLSNHDNVVSRPMTLYGNTGKVNLASAISILGPGTPFIYYGNEIGMTGVSGDDINLRQPFTWNTLTNQQNDISSIFNYNRILISAKLKYKSLRTGSYARIPCSNGNVLAFLRKTDNEQTFVVLNFNDNSVNVSLNFSNMGINESPISQVAGKFDGDSTLTGKISNFQINNISPYGIRIFYIGNNTEQNLGIRD